jgi:DNA-binding NtrC family response regulator
MSEKVLFVDDEPAVLEGYQRILRQLFEIETANSGHQALEKLEKNGPFAVVVSDMRMPQMDGAQLMSKIMMKFPQTIRVMLTGNSDLPAAMRAVNEGNVYRFLTKPCEKDHLVNTLNAALVQYRLSNLKDQYFRAAVESGPPQLDKPVRDAALDDAARHVREILAKTANTRLPSTHSGIYVGKTIYIGPEHVVQRISSTTAVAHPKNLLNATPRLGDVVRIEYSNGSAIVEDIPGVHS